MSEETSSTRPYQPKQLVERVRVRPKMPMKVSPVSILLHRPVPVSALVEQGRLPDIASELVWTNKGNKGSSNCNNSQQSLLIHRIGFLIVSVLEGAVRLSPIRCEICFSVES